VVNAGNDGLEVIRNNSNFDLILLYLAMPEFSGLDVIQTLKNENLLERRNIVVFTASSDQKVLEETERSGVKAIFKKPFSVDDVTALIDNFRKNN
ncbi:MAG: response regulator, partial [Nitrososphaeraceae archaeon]